MKKLWLSVVFAALAPIVANAAEQGKADMPPPAMERPAPMTAGELFEKLDANHDGSISKMEFLEAQPVFQMPPQQPPHGEHHPHLENMPCKG